MLRISHEVQQINTQVIIFDALRIRKGKMDGEQIKAARMMLGITAKELAEAADVSLPTVQRMDSSTGPVPGRYETVEKVRRALEARGIQFLENGQVAEGNGVAIRGLDAGGTLDDT